MLWSNKGVSLMVESSIPCLAAVVAAPVRKLWPAYVAES